MISLEEKIKNKIEEKAKKNLKGVFAEVKNGIKIPLNKSRDICFLHILQVYRLTSNISPQYPQGLSLHWDSIHTKHSC